MSSDAALKLCPKCQSPIHAGSPQGLCPKCVLEAVSQPSEAAGPGTRRAIPPPDIALVREAFPQLEVIEWIGAGGMGTVYKVRQIRLDRIAALKVLPPELATSPAFAERFNREARVLARLNHANIVTVFDYGQAGPFFYFLMELVDGVNLRQAMRAGRFSPSEALGIVPRICEALQYAHDEGVLHRDIKPENVLLDSKGRVKIADFGIAKLVEEHASDITLTASGARLGTPHYMAPEQVENPEKVDHRADIFSLGVVFYEMLTGELPIGRFAPPSSKASLDDRVDEIVFRALAKERELRQQSATQMKTEVEDLGRRTSAEKKPAPENRTASGRRRLDAFLAFLGQTSVFVPLSILALIWSVAATWPRGLIVGVVATGLGLLALRETAFVDPRRKGFPLALFVTFAGPLLLLFQMLGSWIRPRTRFEAPVMFLCLLVGALFLTWTTWSKLRTRCAANGRTLDKMPILAMVLIGLLSVLAIPGRFPVTPNELHFRQTIDPVVEIPQATGDAPPFNNETVPPVPGVPPESDNPTIPPQSAPQLPVPMMVPQSKPLPAVQPGVSGDLSGPFGREFIQNDIEGLEATHRIEVQLRLPAEHITFVELRRKTGTDNRLDKATTVHIIAPKADHPGENRFAVVQWRFTDDPDLGVVLNGTKVQGPFHAILANLDITGISPNEAAKTAIAFRDPGLKFPASRSVLLEAGLTPPRGKSLDLPDSVSVTFSQSENTEPTIQYELRDPRNPTDLSSVWTVTVRSMPLPSHLQFEYTLPLSGWGSDWPGTFANALPFNMRLRTKDSGNPSAPKF